MINLEQVKLLESKVVKAIDYVERLAKENAALHRQEAEWRIKLESYQKRIDELEILVMGFKEDQGQIEEGILAALDRLSQFEKAIEESLRETKSAGSKKSGAKSTKESADADAAQTADTGSGDGQTCFEIPAPSGDGDIPDPLEAPSGDGVPDNTPPKEGAPSGDGGELDIF